MTEIPIIFNNAELSAYRSRVRNTVRCPACNARPAEKCEELSKDQTKFMGNYVDYVHDDRSLAFEIFVEAVNKTKTVATEPLPDRKELQFHIVYMNDTEGWIPIPVELGWDLKNKNGVNELIIGRGIPRVIVPLVGVKFFEIQEI